MHPSFSNGLEHHDHTVVANEARPFSAHGEQKQNIGYVKTIQFTCAPLPTSARGPSFLLCSPGKGSKGPEVGGTRLEAHGRYQ